MSFLLPDLGTHRPLGSVQGRPEAGAELRCSVEDQDGTHSLFKTSTHIPSDLELVAPKERSSSAPASQPAPTGRQAGPKRLPARQAAPAATRRSSPGATASALAASSSRSPSFPPATSHRPSCSPPTRRRTPLRTTPSPQSQRQSSRSHHSGMTFLTMSRKPMAAHTSRSAVGGRPFWSSAGHTRNEPVVGRPVVKLDCVVMDGHTRPCRRAERKA